MTEEREPSTSKRLLEEESESPFKPGEQSVVIRNDEIKRGEVSVVNHASRAKLGPIDKP